jgi:hypothetical protein
LAEALHAAWPGRNPARHEGNAFLKVVVYLDRGRRADPGRRRIASSCRSGSTDVTWLQALHL